MFLDVCNSHMQGRLHLRLLKATTQGELPVTELNEKTIYCGKRGDEFYVDTYISHFNKLLPDTLVCVSLSIDGEHVGYDRVIMSQGAAVVTFKYITRQKGDFALMFQDACTSDSTMPLHNHNVKLGTIAATFSIYRLHPNTPSTLIPRSSTSLPHSKTVPVNKKCFDRASLVAGDGRLLSSIETGNYRIYPMIYPAVATYSLTVHYHDEMVFNLLKKQAVENYSTEEYYSDEECEDSEGESVVVLPPPPSPPRVIIDLTKEDETPKKRQATGRSGPKAKRRL